MDTIFNLSEENNAEAVSNASIMVGGKAHMLLRAIEPSQAIQVKHRGSKSEKAEEADTYSLKGGVSKMASLSTGVSRANVNNRVQNSIFNAINLALSGNPGRS